MFGLIMAISYRYAGVEGADGAWGGDISDVVGIDSEVDIRDASRLSGGRLFSVLEGPVGGSKAPLRNWFPPSSTSNIPIFLRTPCRGLEHFRW
jgi:hypothetical protein